jgi:plasmid stabilization system protein ParE
MSLYQLTRKAREDLDAIWDYIAVDSLAAADRVVDSLAATFARLGEMPSIGRIHPDIASDPIRLFTSAGFTIIYRSDTIPVRILRVSGRGRDLTEILRDDDE